MLLCCYVVSEDEVELILRHRAFSCDRSDRVVRSAVRLSIDKRLLICICLSLSEDLICQIYNSFRVCRADPYVRNRPLYDPGLNIFVTLNTNGVSTGALAIAKV